MFKAYVLLKFRRAETEEPLAIQTILKEVRRVQGVREAHALFGDIDGIALIEASSAALLTSIIQALSAIPGVERTDTRIVVP